MFTITIYQEAGRRYRLLRLWIPIYSHSMDSSEAHPAQAEPRGMTAIGVFLFFGALMAFFAGTTLVWRGTFLDRVWELNPRAYAQLGPQGKMVGIPFLFLSYALAQAGVGWFKRQISGWRLAILIISVQAAGDLINAIRGRFFEGLIGVTIAGALLFYLLRPSVRAMFEQDVSKGI
jgi:hypothetical protein